jgi:hypothetical protein
MRRVRTAYSTASLSSCLTEFTMKISRDRLLPSVTIAMFFGAIIVGLEIAVTTTVAMAADSGPAASASAAEPNTLSAEEKAAGWKLLFDGKSTNGWRNYKKQDVSSGWQVKDGALVCADPKKAGDIITNDKYDSFELALQYNISEGGNSGVIFHATEEQPTVWMTGPEVQLFDNNQPGGHENQLAGWLYQLYHPVDDAKTGKPIDATKPAGQWNDLRIVITPDKSSTYINGVKYYDFVIGSPDWNDRVAKSKFGSMEKFGKATSGHIALQGDHGAVSFRNIKVRPIESK